MKSVEVISASNIDESYVGFVAPFIRSWLQQPPVGEVRFHPKVLLVSNELPKHLTALNRYIQLVEPKKNSSFESQILRLMYAPLSDSDIVLTSDIDMIPLNPRFLSKGLRAISHNPRLFVIVRDSLPPGQFPICYSMATPKSWARVTEIKRKSDIDEELRAASTRFANNHSQTDHSWTADQEWLYEKVSSTSSSSENILKLTDADTGFRRLDRKFVTHSKAWVHLTSILKGSYSDYHFLRPPNRYRLVLEATVLALTARRRLLEFCKKGEPLSKGGKTAS